MPKLTFQLRITLLAILSMALVLTTPLQAHNDDDGPDDGCGRVELLYGQIGVLNKKVRLIDKQIEHKTEQRDTAKNPQARKAFEEQIERLEEKRAHWLERIDSAHRDAAEAAVSQQETACDIPNLYWVGGDVSPFVDELPGSYGPDPRPLASLRDARGKVGHFFANELVVETSEAPDIAARWNGAVLVDVPPVFPGGLALSLIVVDTSGVETAAFADLQAQLTDTRGAIIEVSSEAGLAMLTVAAAEAAAGHMVGINWIARTSDYADGLIRENPTGPGGWSDLPGRVWSDNPYDWIHMRAGSSTGLGVVEAWTAMDEAGKLENKVGIGILDGGFYPDVNGDFPPGFRAISVVGATAALNTQGLDPSSTDHGTLVLNAAAASADNRTGVIGTGSPVADTVAIFTGYDLFHTTSALDQARMSGVKVANMSYGGWLPTGLEWSLVPFDVVFQAMHDAGLVLVAAAGNDSDNNDNRVCLGDLCWETGVNWPCEMTKIYCIGGIQTWLCSECDDGDEVLPRQRAPGSNRGRVPNNDFGIGDPNDPTVDIWAPYWVLTGPSPTGSGTDGIQQVAGTSFASPYVAGVAALVWAVDPSLGPGDVMRLLHRSGDIPRDSEGVRDPEVKLIIDPLQAVTWTLDSVCPCTSIQRPGDGNSFPEGDAISPRATIYGGSVASADWIVRSGSSSGPVVATRSGLSASPIRVIGGGPHVYQLSVTFDSGDIETDQVSVNYINSPPSVDLLGPLAGAVLTDNELVPLSARSVDAGYPDGVPDGNVNWYLDDNPTPLATGHEPIVSFSGVPLGFHNLRVEASDGFETASDFIGFELIAGGANTPPSITISNPADSEVIIGVPNGSGWVAAVDFQAIASDPDPADILMVDWFMSKDGGPLQNVGPGAQILDVPLEIESCFGSTFTITAIVSDGINPDRSDTVVIQVRGSAIC